MTAEYATYRYMRCVVNVMLLLSQLSVSFSIRLGNHESMFKGKLDVGRSEDPFFCLVFTP